MLRVPDEIANKGDFVMKKIQSPSPRNIEEQVAGLLIAMLFLMSCIF